MAKINNVAEVISQILQVAERHRFEEQITRLNAINPATIPIRVAFLGEFNTGKTTLVNALLRRKLLPVFDIPTTAVLTEISAGEKDEARVVSTATDGTVSSYDISFGDLADEVTETSAGRKLVMKLLGLEFLPEDMVILDTPGISSLDETHAEITYGELPLVDVAFVVISPLSGTVPLSIVRFLQQFPADLLDKIYFIVSRTDLLAPQQLKAVLKEFREVLTDLIVEPKILPVSGKIALEGLLDADKYEQSGIVAVRELITDTLPKYRSAIILKRYEEAADKEKNSAIALLNLKKEALNWAPSAFESEIRQGQQEINAIEQELAVFKQTFKSVRVKVTGQIGTLIDEYAGTISHKLAHNEAYDALLSGLISEIKQRLESGITELRNIRFQQIGESEINIGAILEALIEKETSSIRDISNLLTDIATFALTVWVVPGTSAFISTGEAIAGTGVVVAQEAASVFRENEKNAGLAQKIGRVAGTVGRMIKEINPLEKIKSAILPYVINPKLTLTLKGKINTTIQHIFSLVEQAVEVEIEAAYLTPLNDKRGLLTILKQQSEQEQQQIEMQRSLVQSDIDLLQKMQP